MDDFIFRGRDIAEFDAVAAFGASMRIGGKIARSEYDLAGGGTIEIGEPVYQTTQRTVSITPRDGREATPEWRREILAWLQAGRGELTVHNDPDVHFIAQFDAEGTFGTKDWPLGALQLTATVQPFVYAQRMTQQTVTTVSGQASLRLQFPGALSAPLSVRMESTTATLSAATLAIGGHELRLRTLSLGKGKVLTYCAGDRYRGEPASLVVNGVQGYDKVEKWAILSAGSGETLTIATTGGQAKVTVSVRGRWAA